MKTALVFFRSDGQQNFLRIHLRRKRHLDQNAVDLGPAVEAIDDGEQFAGCDRFRGRQSLAMNPQLVRSLDFTADIDLRSGIVSYKHDRKTRRLAESRKPLRARPAFVQDLIADAAAIENLSHV